MTGLDPENWDELRGLGHRMLDDMIDRLATQRDRPVWRPMPDAARAALRTGLPVEPTPPEALYDRFSDLIAPYATGNTHPGFMGWVHGGGTAVGMLAELLAGGLNANCGGRDHAPIEVEREVIRWAADMLGFPPDCSGLLVTGSSMANMIAVITASRATPDGQALRRTGVGGRRLVGYAAATAHGCIARAFDLAGLGTDALRIIPVDDRHRMDLPALRAAIRSDRDSGAEPFIVIGTAGTVDTGAIDDLDGIADIARRDGLWFHVDGAFGALAMLSPDLRPALCGLERADSVAFDFHKWAQVPYDAGCILVREPGRQAAAFAQSLAYLSREDRGLAGNAPWFCDLGPDLSRGFRALKVWMTLGTYGTARMGRMVDACCAVARHLAERVEREPMLELLAPVTLNIVCFRVRVAGTDLDALNGELVKDLHESGVAAPSTTMVGGVKAIRAAIVNHRTVPGDVDRMVDEVLRLTGLRHEAI
ncbi:cytochrome D ubiquinol oxidase subunit I [Gluconacetobacter azotocaptans]|uniref:Cytochrome D ubiquinol oxidase subunit I n=1 Tax=Gluconacetobacter azotocaptans TaxID=142834 RepID=A0A7W4JU27_9PROT|nr:pyridoxal-dependent decarboxylase [Gluconacetobacter azotocaptans]MBB2190883.1 cytochrome D ubiquinol oxidase subunit I [Gluconacetobacter azotocaptans]GBQ31644.1 aromatic-L-amino-acid decarboxylase [Gluconacetobacter azotocaptans DSM 13594]